MKPTLLDYILSNQETVFFQKQIPFLSVKCQKEKQILSIFHELNNEKPDETSLHIIVTKENETRIQVLLIGFRDKITKATEF